MDTTLVTLKAKHTQDVTDLSDGDRLDLLRSTCAVMHPSTLTPLLPLLLNLRGKPYNLVDHFPFEPLFRTRMPRKTTLCCGRQVGKSLQLAAHGIVISAAIPHIATLYVTPLFEMIRRFSNNYLRPFIEQSPLRDLLVGRNNDGSVLQRTFRNGSHILCSYAGLDATRIRSASMDRCVLDEAQDLDPDHLPVIQETMSASRKWGMTQVSGTAKSTSTTLAKWWTESSQAEWCIKCKSCSFWNIPAKEFHLDKMLGEETDVSEARPGTVCANCSRPISPRGGRWYHRFPDRRWDHVGYHIPQILLPMHYAEPDKWKALLGKRRGLGNYTATKFYNEVMGESMDEGSGLVTRTELQRAACLHPNTKEESLKQLRKYRFRVLGADWGGGGEDETSFTVLAVLGMKVDGTVDVIYGERLLNPFDHIGEAKRAHALFKEFRCLRLAHDYTGAGALRETFLLQSGIDKLAVVPIQYVRAARAAFLKFMPATVRHPRAHFRMDKPRSLLLTCACLKLGLLRFFRYDYVDNDNPGLVHDFLALRENKIETRVAGEIYTIQRHAGMHDDFAQAVNIGIVTLFHMTNQWPDVSRSLLTTDMGHDTGDDYSEESAES